MKKIVGVMGPGEKQATLRDLELAFAVGKIVAAEGAVLLCGGMSGVMEESAKGAQSIGGITVGIGPEPDKNSMNSYLDIPLVTAMGPARNYMNVVSSDVLVFVSVASPGTLSELAFAIQKEKPSIIINASQKLREYIWELEPKDVVFVEDVETLRDILIQQLARI